MRARIILTTIGRGAFQDCTQLHTLLLPASLQTIDEQAFEGCYNFYELYCAAPLPPAVVSASAFDDLRAVDVLVPNDAVAHAFADHHGRADVNGDGQISAVDISQIVNIIAGLEE